LKTQFCEELPDFTLREMVMLNYATILPSRKFMSFQGFRRKGCPEVGTLLLNYHTNRIPKTQILAQVLQAEYKDIAGFLNVK
jgi:hypothetical protein